MELINYKGLNMESMTASELKSKAIESIKHYTDLGNKVFNTNMTYPKADFSLRGTVGGKYATSRHTVIVNMILFAENVDKYLNQTIPHEVAHAFQRHIYGHYKQSGYSVKRIMPHGNEWKRIMLSMGKDPKRCHNYDTSNSTARTVSRDYSYSCNCNTPHNLTVTRHRRMQSNKAVYRCVHCKAALRYNG